MRDAPPKSLQVRQLTALHSSASKIASFFLGVTFLLTLWWGRRDWLCVESLA